jgi:UDP-N-acetylmuramate--alanine ligase
MNTGILERPCINKVHFIGIGGISMSGLAQILRTRGYSVTGSDERRSDITDFLEKEGIPVYIGHSSSNVQSADLVVYTAAVKDDNPELIQARELSIPTISRAILLGEIMAKYDYSIAVAGTHGKTTTTSMISVIMLEAGKDPTIHIGGKNDIVGGTVKTGGRSYFITEADEYSGSFLALTPSVAVILNIEYDHADYYSDIHQVSNAFLEFARRVPADGYVIGNADDEEAAGILGQVNSNLKTFGISSTACNFRATDIKYDFNGCASFELLINGRQASTFSLKVAGIHNVYNALAAIAACHTAGCDIDELRNGLDAFHGAGRRLESKGIRNGVKVLDDYAHHPSEIKAALSAVRMMPASRTWCVFQPHTYSRTKVFLSEFADSFNDTDTVVILDIYAAREKNTGEIHASMLADEINRRHKNKAFYISSFEKAVELLKNNTSPGDIVLTMGAGDVYKVGELFLSS